MLPLYAALAASALVAVLGGACMVEMVYHLQFNGMVGPQMPFFGLTLNAKAPGSWLGAGAVLLAGLAVFEVCRRRFVLRWESVQQDTERGLRRNGQTG